MQKFWCLLLVGLCINAGCDWQEDPSFDGPIIPFKHVDFNSRKPGEIYDIDAVVKDFGAQPLYVQQGLAQGAAWRR